MLGTGCFHAACPLPNSLFFSKSSDSLFNSHCPVEQSTILGVPFNCIRIVLLEQPVGVHKSRRTFRRNSPRGGEGRSAPSNKSCDKLPHHQPTLRVQPANSGVILDFFNLSNCIASSRASSQRPSPARIASRVRRILESSESISNAVPRSASASATFPCRISTMARERLILTRLGASSIACVKSLIA